MEHQPTNISSSVATWKLQKVVSIGNFQKRPRHYEAIDAELQRRKLVERRAEEREMRRAA